MNYQKRLNVYIVHQQVARHSTDANLSAKYSRRIVFRAGVKWCKLHFKEKIISKNFDCNNKERIFKFNSKPV